IQRAVSAFLSDLAALEVRSGDEDEEAPTPGVREDAAPVPRDAETRFQLARARQEEWKLRRMQREHADLAKATRRLAAFRRRVLAAPLGGAVLAAGARAARCSHLLTQMADFDLASLLTFQPPRWLCEKCLALIREEPSRRAPGGKVIPLRCPVCKVEYVPTD